MAREEIFDGVQDIFKYIFDDDSLTIIDTTSSDDIGDWDSLSHINLICAIENEFKVKFALGELQALNNVGAMIDLIVVKMGI